MGHNAPRPRLDLLAEDARKGLARVAKGEAEAIEGWLIYGAALNEGRALFSSDEQFGEWVRVCQLDTHDRHDRAAAMWAARDRATFEEMRTARIEASATRAMESFAAHPAFAPRDAADAGPAPREEAPPAPASAPAAPQAGQGRSR